MFKVDVSYFRKINFAMQQNHVSVVRTMSLENETSSPIDHVKIKLSLVPDFGEDAEQLIDTLQPGQLLVLDRMQMLLSAQKFAELTEKINCELVLRIWANEEEVFQERYPVECLPFDHWAGGRILPEMLSSFVTPNYPAIAAIVHRASHFLKQWTGDPSFNAYQSRNPDRVKKQMAALYEAIAELQIVYCVPPASFETAGQRIRTCDNMLATKLGTCIDMALLYASCLEAVGINPILVLIHGHAFSGGWLVEKTFSDSVSDDMSLLTKRIADGINEVALVETTSMNAGKNIAFDEAMRASKMHLSDPTRFELLIDVQRCRFVPIHPLPLRIHNEHGWTIIEDAPTERNNEAPKKVTLDARVIDIQSTSISKQQLWERKLLDLSLRNNLLNIRLTKSTLQLISTQIPLLEDALADGQEFAILPKPGDWDNGSIDKGLYRSVYHSDPMIDLVKQELSQKRLRSYLTESELSGALTNLYRSSRLSLEENGANTLYLALGVLKWFETPLSETPRYAPILLLPVEIIRKSAQKGYVIRSRDEDVLMNITLLEMLKQDFDLHLGGLDVLPRDESGVDVQLVFNTIRKGIMHQSKWDVEEIAILGIFSFNKFIMWNDIHNNAETLCDSKIVRSLVSGKLEWEEEENSPFQLDQDFKPADIALPISADSFQKEAVCEAASNRSFILHGPPGTGKSQTITNIIADSMYRGKKVLFVAEKMAALSVVQKRLSDIGLAPFCLELHSNKSTKSAVLEQLKATTELIRKNSPENYIAESEKLHALRGELSQYVELLHQRQASGMSLYDALYRYTINEDNSSDFEFPQKVMASLSDGTINKWRDHVEQMQVCAGLLGSLSEHPLREITTTEYSLSLKTEAKDLLSRQKTLLQSVATSAQAVEQLFGGHRSCTTLPDFEGLQDMILFLLDQPRLLSPLIKIEALADTISALRIIIEHGRLRDRLSRELLSQFNTDILKINAEQLLNDWKKAQTKWFLPKYLEEKKVLRLFKEEAKNMPPTKERIPALLDSIILYQSEQQILDKQGEYYSQVLGRFWEDWDSLEAGSDAAEALQKRLLPFAGDIATAFHIREALAQHLSEGMNAFLSLHQEKLTGHQTEWNKLLEVNTQLTQKMGMTFEPNSEDWIDRHKKRAQRMEEHLDNLRDWCTWNRVRQDAQAAGLKQFCAYMEQREQPDMIGAFEKAVCKGIINLTLDTQPALAQFNGRLFEDKIRKFRELASRFEQLTRKEIFARLAANIPSFVKEAAQSSEVGILQRNIRSGGRGTSIRKLFDSIPSLLTRLTPCMLMSPMSVAQYIDAGNFKFDLVIFDEASQVPTSEAVGAIARGRQTIVVGDPKQMPPTSFFSTSNIDEDNLDKEDMESILDDCLALSMPSRHLLWHYRSKHESLIAFSNTQYYDNTLLTFPSPDDIRSKVTYCPVEGFYDKGKSRQNRAEAEAIIQEILARLTHPRLSRLSMGIVTFSSVQQSLIEDLLNEAFSKHPELEKIAQESAEPIFVKNLENVQGDERDVILFSVGYGPDEAGKVSLNFGPLNRNGGWRRLNVAVSRARYEMKIFSTLKADQIDLARTSAEGVAGLKAFLEYAEKGKSAMAINSRNTIVKEKSLVDLIANQIREQGYDVHTNIGCSGYRIDIGIVHPERKSEYILGVLCDGANYREAKTVRDREIIQQDVLRLLGWNIHRVWTMDWLENAAEVLSGIIRAIKEAPDKTVEEPALPSVTASLEPHEKEGEELPVASPAQEKPNSYRMDYTPSPLTFCGMNSEEFLLPCNTSIIMRQISTVLEYEAPISKDQLCRKVLSSWGISRIGSRIESHFAHLFSLMKLKSTGSGKETFFWRDDQQPREHMTYRPATMTAADICPEEISVAVKEVLEAQIGLSWEDLVRETARLFGFSRLGGIVEASMIRGIEMAIARGFAREEAGKINLNTF